MKYLEPNIQIIILADCDIPLTSDIAVGPSIGGDTDLGGLPPEPEN